MNKPPAFLFYASDFLVDTSAWTPEEVGVYVRLLALEWVNGFLPSGSGKGPNRLALMCGISEKRFRRVWEQVGKKFAVGEDGNLRNPRLECEREKLAAYRSEKAKAGIAGAQKRWSSANNTKQTDSTALGTAISTAIVSPLTEGMANDSFSSSSSSSSSKEQKKQSACSAEKGPECEVGELGPDGYSPIDGCTWKNFADKKVLPDEIEKMLAKYGTGSR